MLFAVATKSRDLNTASDSAITSDLLLYRIFNERINEKNWRRVFPLVLFVGKFTFVGDTPDTLKGEPYKKYHEFTPFFAGPFAPKFN